MTKSKLTIILLLFLLWEAVVWGCAALGGLSGVMLWVFGLDSLTPDQAAQGTWTVDDI